MSRRLQNAVAYMPRTYDCPIPVAHHDIVSVLKAIGTRAISDPFLALLELLKKLEVSRY